MQVDFDEKVGWETVKIKNMSNIIQYEEIEPERIAHQLYTEEAGATLEYHKIISNNNSDDERSVSFNRESISLNNFNRDAKSDYDEGLPQDHFRHRKLNVRNSLSIISSGGNEGSATVE